MALVSYDVSDASDSEEEATEGTSNVKVEKGIIDNSVGVANERRNDEKIDKLSEAEDSKISLALPTPRSKPIIFNSDLSQKLLLNKPNNTKSNKVKIAVPSLSEFDEDLPTPTVKKAQSSKGSGLFALLPPPKNSATFAKEKRLVPDVLRKPPQPKPVVKLIAKPLPRPILAPSVEEVIEEDDDNDEEVDFLGLNKRYEPETVVPVLPEVADQLVIIPIPEEPVVVTEQRDTSFYPPTSEFVPLPQSEDIELDEEALRALCGGNKRRRTQVQAQLIDVSEADVVPDKNEWMVKQLTEEKVVKRQSHKKNVGPSSQQKRKHQITYLAFQAKEQEQELQNQWAANRQTKKQTQSKYGF